MYWLLAIPAAPVVIIALLFACGAFRRSGPDYLFRGLRVSVNGQ